MPLLVTKHEVDTGTTNHHEHFISTAHNVMSPSPPNETTEKIEKSEESRGIITMLVNKTPHFSQTSTSNATPILLCRNI